MTSPSSGSAGVRAVVSVTLRTIREDAARWVVPEQVAEIDEVTPRRLVALLVRHLPLRATTWYRVARAAHLLGVRGVPSMIQRRMLVRFGLEVAPSMVIGGGLYIAHPVGCVLMAERIGRNLTVIGAATFGTRTDARWPVIGDDVFIGIGARVLGGITVGDGARIGAGAIVLDDVDAGTTVVGAPARSIADRSRS